MSPKNTGRGSRASKEPRWIALALRMRQGYPDDPLPHAFAPHFTTNPDDEQETP